MTNGEYTISRAEAERLLEPKNENQIRAELDSLRHNQIVDLLERIAVALDVANDLARFANMISESAVQSDHTQDRESGETGD